MKKKNLKLKKGDRVWLTVPMNGVIVRINKEMGYTIKLDNQETEVAYYGDDEIKKIPRLTPPRDNINQ